MADTLLADSLIVELQCFVPITVYIAKVKAKHVVFEQYDAFQKSGYRNRYLIDSAGGVLTLSVPVLGGRETKAPTRQVRIDNRQAWQRQHWRALTSAYNHSAYFGHYRHTLEDLYVQQYEWLWDFNLAALNWTYRQLHGSFQYAFSEEYRITYPEEVLDWRNRQRPGNRHFFPCLPYSQVFSRPFSSNLCILDLLFNLGPQALSYFHRQPPWVMKQLFAGRMP